MSDLLLKVLILYICRYGRLKRVWAYLQEFRISVELKFVSSMQNRCKQIIRQPQTPKKCLESDLVNILVQC